MRNGVVLTLCALLQIFGTLTFMYGFFPQRISAKFEPDVNRSTNNSGAKIDRLVLMVIDAFGYDFLQAPEYIVDMPMLHKSINERESISLRAHVQAPTVTLPRIKVSDFS
jgi:predicted AlkP superfamily pyrophosphatase or phosphodiesterase